MGLFDMFSSKSKKVVLIIEDDVHLMNNHKMFFENDRELNQVYQFEFAMDKLEYKSKIKTANAVVSDYYMGDLRFEDVWLDCSTKKVPLILMTGEITKKFTGTQIFKPVKYQALKNIVLDIFNQKYMCPEFGAKKNSVKKVA